LFFRRGLAGEILDTLRNPIERSLERPSAVAFNPELRVRLRPRETDVDLLIRRMHALLSMEFDADWDSMFMKAALYLIQDEGEIYRTALSLKAKRLSTRTEVQRRVFRGRDYLLSNLRSERMKLARHYCERTLLSNVTICERKNQTWAR
jgi:hypothetical protein